ncbi:unnamed protein product [Caenorhabditis angaria]|uniref:MPN domain-containing protein n=1 Tax=Caenorhabditis angaria TaxID=860376 RepID=A0A9P1IMK2_9PELO|nr:unnamed protein product [Caenorhabditis angaria]
MNDRPIDEALLDPVVRLKKIIGSAEQMKVSAQVPLLRYYRSLLEMERMAFSYIKDMNLERAFILLYRFSWFAISELKTHPDYEHHDSAEKKQVIASLTKNMELADQLKNEIRQAYQLQSDYYNFEEQQRKLRLTHFEEWLATRSEALLKSAELLKIAEAGTHRIGMTMGHVLPVQLQPDEMHAQNSPPRKREKSTTPDSKNISPDGAPIVDPQVTTDGIDFADVIPAKRPTAITSPPVVPGTSSTSAFRSVKPDNFAQEYPGLDDPPEVCRSNKPGAPVTESFGKTMAVPSDLVDKFLAACENNTLRNVETCGILGGSLVRDRFVITHVVLPKQSGTSDGCSSEDDVGVATVLSSNNLLSLGWIHTHPSQTAFLSSVDLHTHHGYQQMMEESIAIVCAPSHNSVGTFVLTSEGMTSIGNCDQRGFHPHPEALDKLFTSASHVHYTPTVSAEIVDLR